MTTVTDDQPISTGNMLAIMGGSSDYAKEVASTFAYSYMSEGRYSSLSCISSNGIDASSSGFEFQTAGTYLVNIHGSGHVSTSGSSQNTGIQAKCPGSSKYVIVFETEKTERVDIDVSFKVEAAQGSQLLLDKFNENGSTTGAYLETASTVVSVERVS